MNDGDNIAHGFASALRANERYVAPSLTHALGAEEAYAVQRAFNALRTEPLIGFKSAANAPALQTALGLSGPITGALFATGERAPGSTIRRGEYRTLLIETELGFRTARRIDTPVKSIPELRAATTTCTPMIELADPGFDRARMTGTDLIAANSASAGFIRGRPATLGVFDVNAVHVSLKRDGELLHEARSGDLMGDQWQALKWLVNRVLELGYVIDAGHLLMTGSLGPAHPAAPGRYLAAFTGMGEIEFDIG